MKDGPAKCLAFVSELIFLGHGLSCSLFEAKAFTDDATWEMELVDTLSVAAPLLDGCLLETARNSERRLIASCGIARQGSLAEFHMYTQVDGVGSLDFPGVTNVFALSASHEKTIVLGAGTDRTTHVLRCISGLFEEVPLPENVQQDRPLHMKLLEDGSLLHVSQLRVTTLSELEGRWSIVHVWTAPETITLATVIESVAVLSCSTGRVIFLEVSKKGFELMVVCTNKSEACAITAEYDARGHLWCALAFWMSSDVRVMNLSVDQASTFSLPSSNSTLFGEESESITSLQLITRASEQPCLLVGTGMKYILPPDLK